MIFMTICFTKIEITDVDVVCMFFHLYLHCFFILIFSWPWWAGSLGSAGLARWVSRSSGGRDP